MHPLGQVAGAYHVPIALAFGLVLGSFLNVVVHRLPRGESVVTPRSRCPACGRAIAAWDNIPLLSYLWLRGRCRGCKARISLRYPAMELVSGLVIAGIALRYGPTAMALLWMIFAAALLAAAAIDFDHRIIPDELSLGGLLLGLVAVPLVRSLYGDPLGAGFVYSALGALLGGGSLWSIGFLHARLSTALGRRFEHWPGEGEALPKPSSLDYWVWFPGMGFGDVKLMAMIGAFVGPVGVVETIVAASTLGLALGLGWALATRSWTSPFGFGPALAVGALLVVLLPRWLLPF